MCTTNHHFLSFRKVARGDPLSVFATHEPSVWLQVNKTTGEVDWRATTAKLNLLSAAQVELIPSCLLSRSKLSFYS
jgi:hypothetical protein